MSNTYSKNTNANSETELHNLLYEGLIAIEKKEYSSMEEVFEEIEKKFFYKTP